ncbi:hypothetical protein CPB83DRAFT_843880 [Crepidotus variabilis]|uniref:Uncharacterized protein n=1 Tax=Crepidotus variabilis TaxID=179855 RepID=A0A9P6ET85_9AGAR|nr:hypothetical protein CPB83DRAFT_843880 [Crepidotus variabilis]
MPSVRVKGRIYTPIQEVFPGGEIEQSAEGDVAQTPGEPAVSPPRLFNRLSLPLLRQSRTSTTTFVTPRRPRALTTASRVHAHCTIRETRPSPDYVASPTPIHHSPLGAAGPYGYTPKAETHDIEGQSAVLRLRSHGDPGRVESSINLSHYEDGEQVDPDHHHDDVVENLDVIDPQVGVFANLTNAANAIVIPPSSWYSRKPVLVLPTAPSRKGTVEEGSMYEDSLDRHVDDVLNNPSKIRRTLMGVWSFLKTPMGAITGIYGFLIVFWGAAIVIFLARIINFHNPNTQGFWIEVSSQVETGLFTVTSIGLIPSRVLDTYRVWKIWRYKQKTTKLREKAGLPQLFDVDDLPDPIFDPNYVHVLTEWEQKDLTRQQRKFQYSQTWYRAHGTETHRAFPISVALWICFLNDGNSIFQAFLCGTMWGLNRFERPPWTTGILIPGSFLCGIGAAVLIWRGGERTKRVEEVKERLRKALETSHAEEPKPIIDDQLQESLATKPIDQTAKMDEKSNDPIHDPETIIDEQMTVPPVEGLQA